MNLREELLKEKVDLESKIAEIEATVPVSVESLGTLNELKFKLSFIIAKLKRVK